MDKKEYDKKFLKENYHTMPLRIPKKLYAEYLKELKKNGKSFNGFVNEKLKEMIKNEN
jgi:predicted HicB family RNase H-like nuclease